MTTPRRNEVMPFIQRLAPQTIAYLQVPLTPARAARLADVVLRTGVDPQTLVTDLLDDMIFSLVECGGKASCTEAYSAAEQPQSHRQTTLSEKT
jgi:ABC-type molybdate transport system ATPase subunit